MSITLTNPISLTVGGVAQSTDAQAAAIYLEVVFPDQIRMFFRSGTVAAGVFSAGAITGPVIVSVNTTTGAWVSTSGQSGNLSGPGLTNLQNTLKGWRNAMENFAVNQNLFPGTAVAW